MKKSKYTLIIAVLASLGLQGCNLGGRPINYAPQVTENLQYLQRTSQEMAESAQVEFAKGQPADQLQPLLAAIVRGSVSEVQKSLGGFYLVDGATYDAVTQGGVGTGPRELDPVEKAQLDVLVQKVILSQKYGESVNNFYEREVAQVASPVILDGKVIAVAWIRRHLPSELQSVYEEPKFNRTATQKKQ
jgi:hypothetical protein